MARKGPLACLLASGLAVSAMLPAFAGEGEPVGEGGGFLSGALRGTGGLGATKPKPQKPEDKPFGIEPWLMPDPSKPEPLPEPPPMPSPTPAGRDEAAERAREGEDQLSRFPPDPETSGRLAREYMRAADPNGASRVLDRLIDGGAADAEAYRLRSAARFQNEDWQGAYGDARTALSMDPSDKIAAELAGTSRMQLQRLGLKPPADVKPGQQPERQEMPRDEAPRQAEAGQAATGSGPVPLLGGESNTPDPRRAFFTAFDRKLAIGGKQEAFLDVTRYLDRNPNDAEGWIKRAYLLNRSNNPKAALADSDRALALTPDDAAGLREKAYALIQLGRVQDALGMLERAIGLQPKNALGYLYRAMAHKSLGELEAALADFAHAAELDGALQNYYDAAVAEFGGGHKKGGSTAANWRVRGVLALVALPLLLFGLWSGARHLSGRTTRGREETVEPVDLSPSAAETLVDGNVLGGLYRIGRVLGRGGMGVVFEAWDQGLERKVAIKQLRTPEGAQEDYDRFLKEARLVARLQHPNIVQIHSLVEENSLLYLVFELVDGKPLDAVLAENGRLSPEQAYGAVRDVCAALDCAHEARIIHRDLKPSNIMVTAKGAYKVMDFGIAHQAQSEQMMTQTGAWGTPPYMAPEQERGVVSRESDLYALACTVYELLTGGRPFGPGADKTTQTVKPVSTLVHGLAPAIDSFMARALAPDPAHRFHSGREFLAAYEACLTGRIAA